MSWFNLAKRVENPILAAARSRINAMAEQCGSKHRMAYGDGFLEHQAKLMNIIADWAEWKLAAANPPGRECE